MTPEGWRVLPIGEVARVVSGIGFPREYQGNRVGPFPFFKVSDMNARGNERELRVAANLVDAHVLRTLKGTAHPAGTVVFPKVGAALLTNKRRRLAVVSAFDNNVMGLVPTACDPNYLYYSMQTIDFSNYVQPGAVPSVNGSTVGSIRVLVPTLPEQSKIAAILSSVDDAIEKTQAVIDQVQVVKRGLMQELLTRGLAGRHTRFKQTEIGEIPVEWELLRLAELAETQNGIQTGPFGSQLHASEYVESGVPVIMPRDLVSGRVSGLEAAQITDQKVKELARHRVQPGDILFARRGDIGRAGLVMQGEEGWVCGTGCFRFRPKDTTMSRFLRHWVAWPCAARWLAEHAVGQTMLNLNSSILGRLPVVLPSEDERAHICAVLDASMEQMQTLQNERIALAAVKRSLMSVLLTGDLRVIQSS